MSDIKVYKAVDGRDLYVIEHHGIKGQKWGTRHGPPYPLSDKAHNSVVKGKDGSSKTASSKSETSKPKASKAETPKSKPHILTRKPSMKGAKADAEKERKSIKDRWNELSTGKKVAIGIAATAALATATYLVVKNVKPKSIETDFLKGKFDASMFDSETGLLRKTEKEAAATVLDDMKHVNPNFGKPGYDTNCIMCSSTMELRRRGFNVEAGAELTGNGIFEDEAERMWNDAAGKVRKYSKLESMGAYFDATGFHQNTPESYHKETLNTLASHGPGARGEINVQWKRGFGRHSMFWENDANGVTTVYCTQTGKTYSGESLDKLLATTRSNTNRRLDDCQPVISEMANHKIFSDGQMKRLKK